jgi:hypothetical protein
MRGPRLTSAILRIDALESRLRKLVRRRLESIPVLVRYKTIKQIEFLKEVCAILDRSGAAYGVVGGFAYDGKRGAVSRMHKDLDVAFVADQRGAVESALNRAGYSLRRWSPFITVAEKGRFHVDLYEWKIRDKGLVESMMLDNVIRIPRQFLENTQTVELMGVRYRIVSNEYLLSSLPFIPGEIDRTFVASLPTSAPLEFKTSAEMITVTTEVTVHEYVAAYLT